MFTDVYLAPNNVYVCKYHPFNLPGLLPGNTGGTWQGFPGDRKMLMMMAKCVKHFTVFVLRTTLILKKPYQITAQTILLLSLFYR